MLSREAFSDTASPRRQRASCDTHYDHRQRACGAIHDSRRGRGRKCAYPWDGIWSKVSLARNELVVLVREWVVFAMWPDEANGVVHRTRVDELHVLRGTDIFAVVDPVQAEFFGDRGVIALTAREVGLSTVLCGDFPR